MKLSQLSAMVTAAQGRFTTGVDPDVKLEVPATLITQHCHDGDLVDLNLDMSYNGEGGDVTPSGATPSVAPQCVLKPIIA